MTPRLDDVSADDSLWMFGCLDQWDSCLRWSTQGQSPSPMFLEDRISARHVALQKVARAPGGDPVGLLQVAQFDRQNQHAYLTLLLDGDRQDLAREAVARFLGLAFHALPLRMLYLAAPADDLAVIDHVGPVVQEIGRLRDHERRGPGVHEDVVMYEVLATDVHDGR